MKKSALLILLLANLFAVTSVYSANMSGRIGIGYDTSVDCASVRFFIGSIGIDILAGFRFEPQDTNLGDQTALLTLRGAGYVLFPIEVHEKVNLNLFAGLELENVGSHFTNGSALNFYIRAGVSPEIFLLDNVSVEANFGLEFSYIRAVAPSEYRIAIGLYGNTISIVQGFAFHVYLGK
jgi:hypothetical protein